MNPARLLPVKLRPGRVDLEQMGFGPRYHLAHDPARQPQAPAR